MVCMNQRPGEAEYKNKTILFFIRSVIEIRAKTAVTTPIILQASGDFRSYSNLNCTLLGWSVMYVTSAKDIT